MLRIAPRYSAPGTVNYFFSSPRDLTEMVGDWGGVAAERLGLKGKVRKMEFEALARNLHPVEKRRITQRTRAKRIVGYDFNFNPPKSVSIAYALSNSGDLILNAFRLAQGCTMRRAESLVCTRVRKNHADCWRLTATLVWAEMLHSLSRPVGGVVDPQLHGHCFAFNLTFDQQESIWKAAQFHDVIQKAPELETHFRAELAANLVEAGFGIVRKGSLWELDGIPDDALTLFSQRCHEIELNFRLEGEIGDKHQIGRQLREAKIHRLDPEKLRLEWQQRLNPSCRLRIERFGPSLNRRTPLDVANHVLDICEAEFVRTPFVSERELLKTLTIHAPGSVRYHEVQTALDRCPDFIYTTRDGMKWYTSRKQSRSLQELDRELRMENQNARLVENEADVRTSVPLRVTVFSEECQVPALSGSHEVVRLEQVTHSSSLTPFAEVSAVICSREPTLPELITISRLSRRNSNGLELFVPDEEHRGRVSASSLLRLWSIPFTWPQVPSRNRKRRQALGSTIATLGEVALSLPLLHGEPSHEKNELSPEVAAHVPDREEGKFQQEPKVATGVEVGGFDL